MPAAEPERIREDIRRFRALLQRTTDARAKEVLNELIRELEAQLGEGPASHDRT